MVKEEIMKCPLLCVAWNIQEDDRIDIECMKEKCGWWNTYWERCGIANN